MHRSEGRDDVPREGRGPVSHERGRDRDQDKGRGRAHEGYDGRAGSSHRAAEERDRGERRREHARSEKQEDGRGRQAGHRDAPHQRHRDRS